MRIYEDKVGNQLKTEAGMKTYKGVLGHWSEQGSEGLAWVLETEDKSVGFHGSLFIQKNDCLKVFNEEGEVIFDGKLIPDTEIGYRPYPLNPQCGGQVALGNLVCWIQKGWQPDDWARLFIRKNGEPKLRAEFSTHREIL